jgi:hypothetical protein
MASAFDPTFVFGDAPEVIWRESFASIAFLLSFGAVIMLLALSQSKRRGTQIDYFWKRLQISRRGLILTAFVYNILCLFMVFALTITVAFVFLTCYNAMLPEGIISGHQAFIFFEADASLQSIFPLFDLLKLSRNILMVLAFALAAANGLPGEKDLAARKLVIFYLAGGLLFFGPISFYWTEGLQVLLYVAWIAYEGYSLWMNTKEEAS